VTSIRVIINEALQGGGRRQRYITCS